MTILPLIERELVVRARRSGSYWLRFAIGVAGAVLCLPQLLAPDWVTGPGGAGKSVFNWLTGTAFVLCCCAALLTADCIGAERREGTLGLLFLTRIKWFDVVIGKLASNGVLGLAALITLLPLLMFPVLAGGVTGPEALRSCLILLETLFLCLTIGLYSSVRQTDRFKASRKALLLILLISVVPIVLQGVSSPSPWRSPDAFGIISPLCGMWMARDAQYQIRPLHYWACVALLQAIAWSLLLGTGTMLRRSIVADEPAEPAPPLGPNTSRASAYEIAFPRRTWRALRTRLEPAEFLARRQRGLKTILWAGALLGVVYSLGFRAFMPWMGLGRFGFWWFLGAWIPRFSFGLLDSVLFAWAASRLLLELRRSGELELLLTTPIGASAIVSGGWKVLRRALRWPVLFMIAGYLLPLGFFMTSRMAFPNPQQWLIHYATTSFLGLVNLVLGVGALSWIGLWFGMKAPGQARAILWTVSLVKGIPYLISLLSSFYLALGGGGSSYNPDTFYYILSLTPAVLTLAFYLWLIRSAKRALTNELSGVEATLFNFRATLAQVRSWNTQ